LAGGEPRIWKSHSDNLDTKVVRSRRGRRSRCCPPQFVHTSGPSISWRHEFRPNHFAYRDSHRDLLPSCVHRRDRGNHSAHHPTARGPLGECRRWTRCARIFSWAYRGFESQLVVPVDSIMSYWSGLWSLLHCCFRCSFGSASMVLASPACCRP